MTVGDAFGKEHDGACSAEASRAVYTAPFRQDSGSHGSKCIPRLREIPKNQLRTGRDWIPLME